VAAEVDTRRTGAEPAHRRAPRQHSPHRGLPSDADRGRRPTRRHDARIVRGSPAGDPAEDLSGHVPRIIRGVSDRYLDRIERASKEAEASGLGALLVTPSADLVY